MQQHVPTGIAGQRCSIQLVAGQVGRIRAGTSTAPSQGSLQSVSLQTRCSQVSGRGLCSGHMHRVRPGPRTRGSLAASNTADEVVHRRGQSDYAGRYRYDSSWQLTAGPVHSDAQALAWKLLRAALASVCRDPARQATLAPSVPVRHGAAFKVLWDRVGVDVLWGYTARQAAAAIAGPHGYVAWFPVTSHASHWKPRFALYLVRGATLPGAAWRTATLALEAFIKAGMTR